MRTFKVYTNKNQAVRDAYDMLAANVYIMNSPKHLKTFAITSCKPEEGKTSLAIGLAVAMANSGWKVLLIDGDMRKPAAAKRLNQGVELGLSDYLRGMAEHDDVIEQTNIRNLCYVGCGSAVLNPIALLSSARFEQLMDHVQDQFNYVLFDTPALTSVADGVLVCSKADATILVAKMSSTKLKDLSRAKEQLEGLNARILGVVLNRVKKHDYKKYFGSYNYFFNSERFLKNKKVRTSV